jgi:translation initiation factor IF-2
LQKDNVYTKYKDRVGQIVSAEVYQVWKKEILLLDDEENELILPKIEQIPGDFFRKNETCRAVVVKVDNLNNNPKIILSRTSNLFMQRLFELEVPEIHDGLITIKRIARIPGERAKVAVESYDDRIDPVGACVGMKGARIHGIVRELCNENIDIVNYTANTTLFIQRALSPAKISSIKIHEAEKKAEVYLRPEEVSLAIGKSGLNIKLASMLTEYTIDVFRDVDIDSEDIYLDEFSDEIEMWVIEALKNIGCYTAKNVLAMNRNEIIERADLEETTVDEVLCFLLAEFEDEEIITMPIRLNKVTRDLNVGLSTVVEFLHKKGFSVKEDPNAKIDDEAYDLLVKEFKKDKNIKEESEKISLERHHKEKKETVAVEGYDKPKKVEEIKTEIPEEIRPKFVTVGKIDLDAIGKNKAGIKKEKEKIEMPAEALIEPVKVKEITPPLATEEVVEEFEDKKEIEQIPLEPEEIQPPDFEFEEDPVFEEKPEFAASEESDKKTEEKQEPEIELNDTEEKNKEIFRLTKPVIEPTIKVTGKIDLSSINQSTRPKKKSKEEKRKERAEKAGKDKKVALTVQLKKIEPDEIKTEKKTNLTLIKKTEGETEKKKKRNRIKREKIDIEKGLSPALNKQDNSRLRLRKPITKNEVSEEEVQKQIKETLARLTNKGLKKGAKYRREKRDAVSQRQSEQHQLKAQEGRIIKITEFVTANDLAQMMNVPVVQIISTCMSIGIMVSINQRLDAETINIVADEFGYKTEYVSAEVVEAISEELDNVSDLVPRPPIITVMGHVDHGKTSLLDNIRNTNVIAGEAGGITQHIGAYNVELSDGRKITFLDTPGHEAFTAMRARGASVTDIAVIIVAADDNVMPQTIEAINHASAAGVPMVFAINKIDKPGANPEKIKETLAGMNYLVEDWGGKYQSQDISAKQGIGVRELLEKVLLEAELLDLKANPKRKALGSVIESSLDKGRGYVVTMLVQNGTLKMGDVILAGTHYGRVKAMFNERNQKIIEAGPAEPVLILGLSGAPQAGDTIHVMETEQEAREIATKREQLQREQGLRTQKLLTLDDIGRRIAIGNFQQLNVIVKGDVDGSVEALSDSLIRLSTERIQVNVIHKGVGQISESDVILAAASDAIIVGFQVRPSQSARKSAEKEGVDIRLYSIIYNAIEEVKAAMEGMLSPEIKEEITANVEIREVFKITKVGSVAGCMVKEGKIKRGNKIRLIRDGIVIYTGELGSLKRFKDDVREVTQGYECGLNIHKFNDIKVGDIVEAFEEIEVKQTL